MSMSMPWRFGLGAILLAAAGVGHADEPAPTPAEVFGSWSYYNNMGWGAYYRGDLDLARDRFTHAIEYVRPLRKEYPRLLSRSCHDLTRVLCAQGRYADAEPMAKWVVEARDHDPRTRDDVMFDGLYLLAVIHRELGNHEEAVPLLRRAVALEESHMGPGDARLALTLKELADAEAASEALAAADEHYRRALGIHKRYAALNLDLVETLTARADVLARLGREADATPLRREADALRAEAESLPRLADHLESPLAPGALRPAAR